MPNPKSRFYAMQRARHFAKHCRSYLKLVASRAKAGDHVSAASHAEMAHHCAVKAAMWAREWKGELRCE